MRKVFLILGGIVPGQEKSAFQKTEAMLRAAGPDTALSCLWLDGESGLPALKAWLGGKKEAALFVYTKEAGQRTSEIPYPPVGAFVEEAGPEDLILFAGSFHLSELGRRLAAERNRPVLTETEALEEVDGRLYAVRRVMSTHREGHFPAEGAVVLTGREAKECAYEEADPDAVKEIPLRVLEEDEDVFPLLKAEKLPPCEDLGQAGIVFLAGKGLGTRDNIERLKKLAQKWGASVACTRPVALSGWMDPGRIVGISGWSLNARLCIAFGVSGAGPLIRGLSGVSRLIAINTDPAAPIFRYADQGIVEDCTALLEAWEEAADQDQGGSHVI